MPRPSELYATLGVPGMYQPTPWTPNVLPNVFVCPPEEDNKDVFCLFHSGSASPSTFESFCRNRNRSPMYTQRHPSSPTLTNVTALDSALSYIQEQASTEANAPSKPRGDHVVVSARNFRSPSPSVSSRLPSSSSVQRTPDPVRTGATASPHVSFLVEQVEGQGVPPRPASRRSSIFGERPVDRETSSILEVDDVPKRLVKGPQTRSLKSRTAIAFKSMGDARANRVTENDVRLLRREEIEVEGLDPASSFPRSQGPAPNVKQSKRMTFSQLLGSNPSNDVSSTSPATWSHSSTLATPTGDNKLIKRKSMTQLFGATRSSGLYTSQPYASSELISESLADLSTSASLSSPTPKISKRKSMSQLFGLGRSTPSMSMLHVDVDDLDTDTTDARIATLRALEGPSTSDVGGSQVARPAPHRSIASTSVPDLAQSPGVRAATSSPSPSDMTSGRSSRRKSFLSARTFSFLDIHRHFSSRSTPNMPVQAELSTDTTAPVSIPESPNPSSETADSTSSNPPSTDSEPEIEDTVRIFEPRMAVHSEDITGHQRNAVVDDSPELFSSDFPDKDQENYVFSRLSLHEPKDFDLEVESEVDEQPMLELAARLDSLTFDHLAFDPASFAVAVQT